MIITFDLKSLIENKSIDIKLQLLANVLVNSSKEGISAFIKAYGPFTEDDFYNLFKYKLLDAHGKNVEDLTIDDISKTYISIKNISSWINDFVDIFPSGVKNSSGHYIKSGKETAIRKMKEFINKFPECRDPNIIIEATTEYINSQRADGFQYCKILPFFILKDGISTLESFYINIEEIRSKKLNKSNVMI